MKAILAWVLIPFLLLADKSVEVFTLENGMKVILKSNPNEEEEILFQFMAPGGYAKLSPSEQPSGRVASDIIWEAGLSSFDSNQLSHLLYEEASDLSIKIAPFYRRIEGSTYPASLAKLLRLSSYAFLSPQLSHEELRKGLQRLKVNFKSADQEASLDNAVKLLNTQSYPPFTPLSLKELDQVNLETVRNFYTESFSNPADFIFVMVGQFDKEEAAPLIKNILGSIPSSDKKHFPAPPPFPPFPAGSVQKIIPAKFRSDSVTRITYPIKPPITEANIHKLEFLTQLIEIKLRDYLQQTTTKTHGVDVGYEFPFYPYTNPAWMSIQFHAQHAEEASKLSEKIFTALHNLVHHEITENDIKRADRQNIRTEDYWQQESSYWLAELTNVYIWNWNPRVIEESYKPFKITPQEVQNELKSFFDFANRTLVTMQPK